MTLHEGSLIAADEEAIAGKSDTPASPLVSMLGIPAEAEIDVMNDDNAGHYFEHSDRFHMALDLTAGRRGLQALGTAIAHWVEHLLAVDVAVEPLTEMRDAQFTWYVGLDADGTRIGDALWQGEELDEPARGRVVGLFRLTFRDPTVVVDKVKGEPVYLILAMDQDKVLRMKPQNLVTGLPIRHLEAVDMSAPQPTIQVGVIVERAKAQSQWVDFLWRPTAVLAGEPETPRPGPSSRTERRRARRSMPARPRSTCIARDTAQLPQQSRDRRAVALGGAAQDRRRAALWRSL